MSTSQQCSPQRAEGGATLDRRCPGCGSAAGRPLSRYREARLVRCQRCRLVFAGKLPSAAELDDYYAGYPAARALSDLTVRRYDQLLESFEQWRRTGRLLDVGCGDGDFLLAARERGWRVCGSEYGAAPLARARERGLDVRPAPLEPTTDELGSFDVVTSMEVIEHVADPAQEARRFAALLRSGGCLYLTTPNFNSLSRRVAGAAWRAIEYPEHLNLFTPRTLDRILGLAGLARISARTTGASPSDIVAGLRRSRAQPEGRAADTSDSPPPQSPAPGATIDERVRSVIASSPRLDLAVRAANTVLTWSSSGDTIKALYTS